MSERLEEILNDLPGSIRHSGELEELKEYSRSLAERVEDLKAIITERHETVGDWIRKHNSLEDKNRRYREAIEQVKDNIPLKFNHGSEHEAKKNVLRLINMQNVVDEALGGESE